MHTTRAADAHDVMTRFTAECKAAGLLTEIIEKPTRVRVSQPAAHNSLAEIITVRPGRGDELFAFWSWGAEIGPMSDLGSLVKIIAYVVKSDQ